MRYICIFIYKITTQSTLHQNFWLVSGQYISSQQNWRPVSPLRTKLIVATHRYGMYLRMELSLSVIFDERAIIIIVLNLKSVQLCFEMIFKFYSKFSELTDLGWKVLLLSNAAWDLKNVGHWLIFLRYFRCSLKYRNGNKREVLSTKPFLWTFRSENRNKLGADLFKKTKIGSELIRLHFDVNLLL